MFRVSNTCACNQSSANSKDFYIHRLHYYKKGYLYVLFKKWIFFICRLKISTEWKDNAIDI